MRFLDANIFIRFLTGDDEAKAAACLSLFQRLGEGKEEATTSEAIVAEVVCVLSSRSLYRLSHDEIRARLTPILSLRGFRLRQKRTFLRALDLYVAYPSIDFEDALSVAQMERAGITDILSYDTDFDRLTQVKRVEP